MKQKSREALARAAGILTGIIFSIVKKYQEDIRKAVEEAVNRVEREQLMNERIQRIEREFDERIDSVMSYFRDLERRVESIDPIRDDPIMTRKLNETEGLIEWKACPICLRMRNGEDAPR